MKKLTLLLNGLMLSATGAFGGISFDIQAAVLLCAGVQAPVGSRVYLVADTGRDGINVTPGYYTSAGQYWDNYANTYGGDDLIVYTTLLTQAGSWIDTPTLSLGGAWKVGDPLAIIWQYRANEIVDPSVVGPSVQNTVGVYSGPGNPTGDALPGGGAFVSDGWVTPGDGTTNHKLYFVTTMAANEGHAPFSGGTYSILANTALATVVVPEAETAGIAVGTGALLLAWGLRRPKRRD